MNPSTAYPGVIRLSFAVAPSTSLTVAASNRNSGVENRSDAYPLRGSPGKATIHALRDPRTCEVPAPEGTVEARKLRTVEAHVKRTSGGFTRNSSRPKKAI